MPLPQPASLDQRVLILAPGAGDASKLEQALSEAGFPCERCADIQDLCQKCSEGAGTAVLGCELLNRDAIVLLQKALGSAPTWSDLPLILLLMADGDPCNRGEEQASLATLGNIAFLDRPIDRQRLVTAVASALRVRLRQYEMRDLFQRQQRTVQRFDLLAEIANHLLLSGRPEEIVASVFSKIAQHLGLEVYLCYLYDETSQQLRLHSHAGLPTFLAAQREWLNLRDSICGAVAQSRKRSVAEHIQASDDPATAHMKSLGVTAYACFPLVANERLIGTLSFGVRRRDALEQEELAILETVCDQVAVAIERKRTEEALQELNHLLERKVDERTAQLRMSTEQMEGFAYSVSHDLRAPLRAIRGFGQALIEDCGHSLDATGRDYLKRMADGADRLDRLISDLLQYSRVGRTTVTQETVELDALVQSVLSELEPDIRASQAAIAMDMPLPRILAHPPTLRQVLTNLISNALKFMPPGTRPNLRLWGTQDNDTARLWIQDNGIGIASAHHERIFGVFERLHATEDYPGTGIGLAIVAKGIARMGGRVGVESDLGQGSRFWIELPRAPIDRPRKTA